MPNWCANSVTLTHSDPAQVDAAIAAYQQGRLLEHFVPLPGGEWDYNFCVNRWGTKWDVGGNDADFDRLDANTVTLNFDSAWAPPCQALEQACANGFEVEAYYHEPGMAFCGKFTGNQDGHDDDYREYSSEDADSVRRVIGEELDDFWSIAESMADWDDEADSESQ